MNVAGHLKRHEARTRAMLALAEQEISTLRGKLGQAERLRDVLRKQLGVTGAPPAARASTPLRIAAGSVEGRVLEIVGEATEPVALVAIAKETNAGDWQTRRAVNTLVDAGRLVIVGGGRTRKYAPPPPVSQRGRSRKA